MPRIAENYTEIQSRIAYALQRAGRDDKVTLVAVTKTVAAEIINEAIALGIENIGENRVQEIRDKYDYVSPCAWHLIGHLQTNKVKYIINKVDLIHSVDSIKLLSEINNCAKRIGKVQKILIQINVSGEESKFGLSLKEYPELIKHAGEFNNILVNGVMTIAPNIDDKSRLQDIFLKTRKIFLDIKAKQAHNIKMDILSMGMTGDFETAIECGANMVRVGAGIFKN